MLGAQSNLAVSCSLPSTPSLGYINSSDLYTDSTYLNHDLGLVLYQIMMMIQWYCAKFIPQASHTYSTAHQALLAPDIPAASASLIQFSEWDPSTPLLCSLSKEAAPNLLWACDPLLRVNIKCEPKSACTWPFASWSWGKLKPFCRHRFCCSQSPCLSAFSLFLSESRAGHIVPPRRLGQQIGVLVSKAVSPAGET